MDNQKRKWVQLSYLFVSGLTGYVFFNILTTIAATYDLEARFHQIDWFIRGVSFFIAVVVYVVLNRHKKVNDFMNEVILELSRVTWPTQKDTSSATVVVVIMVIISGMFLGFLDYVWTQVIRWII